MRRCHSTHLHPPLLPHSLAHVCFLAWLCQATRQSQAGRGERVGWGGPGRRKASLDRQKEEHREAGGVAPGFSASAQAKTRERRAGEGTEAPNL